MTARRIPCIYGRLALLTNRATTEERIRRLYAQGWSVHGLAELFGVLPAEVSRITREQMASPVSGWRARRGDAA